MPLSIGVRLGADFYVGKERFVVKAIESVTRFTLQHGQKQLKITDERATEVLPGVMVSAGVAVSKSWAKVTVTAPPEVPINRGDKYPRDADD